MNSMLKLLPSIVFLFAFSTIQTASPTVLPTQQHNCLAPILSDISDRDERIKQVEKLFTKDVINDVLTRGISRRMKKPLPETLTTYLKPQGSRKAKSYMPNQSSEQARNINQQVEEGQIFQAVDSFVEEKYEAAAQHLTSSLQYEISESLNDTEMAAFHTSVLIGLRKKHPELFASEQEFNDILKQIVSFSAVLSRQTTPEGPFQYNYYQLAGTMRLNMTDLLTNIAYEIICTLESADEQKDKTRIAYDFIQGLWEEKEGDSQKNLPSLPSTDALPENIKASFKPENFTPNSKYVANVVEYFYGGTNTTNYDHEDINKFLDRQVSTDSKITFAQAAKQHLRAHKNAGTSLFNNKMELMAYNISILILLRDKAPEVFVREDEKDFFAVILQNILTATKIVDNSTKSYSNFRYSKRMLLSSVKNAYFIIAHEIGHKILDYNINIMYENQQQNLWLVSMKELFSNIASVLLLSELYDSLIDTADLPKIMRDRINHNHIWAMGLGYAYQDYISDKKKNYRHMEDPTDPIVYRFFPRAPDSIGRNPSPHAYADAQTAALISDSFLQNNYDVLLPAICQSAKKTPPNINSAGQTVFVYASSDKEPFLTIWRSRFGRLLQTAA